MSTTEYTERLQREIESIKLRLFQYESVLGSGKHGSYSHLSVSFDRKQDDFEFSVSLIGTITDLSALQRLEEEHRLYIKHFEEMTVIYGNR